MTARREPTMWARARGITLIEVLVVLALLGLLLELGASALGPASQAEVLRATNQLVSTVRYAYDRARVYGLYMRLEIDLDKGTIALQQTDARMYLPATDRDGKVVKIDPEKLKRQADRDRAAAEAFNSSLAKTTVLNRTTPGGTPSSLPGGTPQPKPGTPGAGTGPTGTGAAVAGEGGEEGMDPYAVEAQQVPRARPPLFQEFEAENTLSGLGEAIELPKHVKVVGVRTDADPEEIKSGKAYIYFFPGGRTQLAHVLLHNPDNNDEITLKIAPLTGKVEVLSQLEPLKLPDDVNGGTDDLGRKIERRSF